ncbi:MAG: hypothetical protein RL217_1939 [Pseudomonadota bacterium]
MRYCVLFFTLVLSGCFPHYEPLLTLGTNLWIGYEPLYLARELEYDQNQNIRLIELGSTGQALDALRVGKLDMAAVTLDEAILLTQENLPIKVAWVMNISAGADALVVKPKIKQASDLRGKRIGVEQTAVGAYLLSSFLAHTGLELMAKRLAQIMYRSGLIPQGEDVSKLVDERFAHKEL